jgi:hypothetical protein
LLAAASAARAQGAIEAWVQRYNGLGNGDDFARALAVDANGNVFVTGTSYGGDPAYGGSGNDFMTIAYSSAGVPLWTNLYNGPGNGGGGGSGVALDASGNVFVTGAAIDGSGDSYPTTIKYSSAGVPLWTNVYPTQSRGVGRQRQRLCDRRRLVSRQHLTGDQVLERRDALVG